jgi:hypothetical protein
MSLSFWSSPNTNSRFTIRETQWWWATGRKARALKHNRTMGKGWEGRGLKASFFSEVRVVFLLQFHSDTAVPEDTALSLTRFIDAIKA